MRSFSSDMYSWLIELKVVIQLCYQIQCKGSKNWMNKNEHEVKQFYELNCVELCVILLIHEEQRGNISKIAINTLPTMFSVKPGCSAGAKNENKAVKAKHVKQKSCQKIFVKRFQYVCCDFSQFDINITPKAPHSQKSSLSIHKLCGRACLSPAIVNDEFIPILVSIK